MVNFVRAASLEGFADLAMSAGADPVRLCEAVGVPVAATEKTAEPPVRMLTETGSRVNCGGTGRTSR